MEPILSTPVLRKRFFFSILNPRSKVYDLGQLKDDELEALRGKYKGGIYIFKAKGFEKVF